MQCFQVIHEFDKRSLLRVKSDELVGSDANLNINCYCFIRVCVLLLLQTHQEYNLIGMSARSQQIFHANASYTSQFIKCIERVEKKPHTITLKERKIAQEKKNKTQFYGIIIQWIEIWIHIHSSMFWLFVFFLLFYCSNTTESRWKNIYNHHGRLWIHFNRPKWIERPRFWFAPTEMMRLYENLRSILQINEKTDFPNEKSALGSLSIKPK